MGRLKSSRIQVARPPRESACLVSRGSTSAIGYNGLGNCHLVASKLRGGLETLHLVRAGASVPKNGHDNSSASLMTACFSDQYFWRPPTGMKWSRDIKTLYWAQIQTIAPAYPDAARFRRARDSSCSRQRLLRRKSLGPVHSERLRVAAALVDRGWLERRGRMRQHRHARSVMLPLP